MSFRSTAPWGTKPPFMSLTSSWFNCSKMVTGSASPLKFCPNPTVAARTGLPTTVVVEAFVSFVIGKSTPVSYTLKNIPTLVRFVIDWKRGAGKKTAAVSPILRVLTLEFPVWPFDEKLLPLAASSVCDSYSKWANIAPVTVGIICAYHSLGYI